METITVQAVVCPKCRQLLATTEDGPLPKAGSRITCSCAWEGRVSKRLIKPIVMGYPDCDC